MDNNIKKITSQLYLKLKEEVINEYGIVSGDVTSLTLGCFLSNRCNISKCRSNNFVPEDSFRVDKDHFNRANYNPVDYIISEPVSQSYVNITQKEKGRCYPFYRNNCRTILESILKKVHEKDN